MTAPFSRERLRSASRGLHAMYEGAQWIVGVGVGSNCINVYVKSALDEARLPIAYDGIPVVSIVSPGFIAAAVTTASGSIAARIETACVAVPLQKYVASNVSLSAAYAELGDPATWEKEDRAYEANLRVRSTK